MRRRTDPWLLVSAGALTSALSACDGAARVSLQGFLFATPFPTADSEPVTGATAQAWLDTDPAETASGGPLGQVEDGQYLVGFFPGSGLAHVVFEVEDPGAGFVATVVPLVVPRTPTEVDDGVFHVWARAAVDTLLGTSGPMPEEGSGQGCLVGWLADPAQRMGAVVTLDAADGSSPAAAYVGDEGVVDTSLLGAGALGGFVFPAVPEGAAVLHTGAADLAVWIVDGAVTSVRTDGSPGSG